MSEPLTVLVLWQGKDAKKTRVALQKSFNASWTAVYPELGEVAFRTVEDMPKGAGKSWLSLVTSLILECRFAIAIHARDSRTGTEGVGNIWTEVGLWLAHRGPEDLFIACKSRAATPTNLAHWRHCHFKTEAQLVKDVTEWLFERCEATRSTRPDADPSGRIKRDIERVKATFGDRFADWLSEHTRRSANGPWQGSAGVLTLMAELLRMARSARELADLSGHLYRVSHAARVIAFLEEGVRDEVLLGEHRENVLLGEHIENLHSALHEMTHFVNSVLTRAGFPSEPWERLTGFLQLRLSDDLMRAIGQANELSPRQFVASAQSYFVSTSPSKRPAPNKPRPPTALAKSLLADTRGFAELDDLSEQASGLAGYLDTLRIRWFTLTSDAMKMHFNGFKGASPNDSGHGMLDSLTAAIRSLAELAQHLPHNAQRMPIPIWPGQLAQTRSS